MYIYLNMSCAFQLAERYIHGKHLLFDMDVEKCRKRIGALLLANSGNFLLSVNITNIQTKRDIYRGYFINVYVLSLLLNEPWRASYSA